MTELVGYWDHNSMQAWHVDHVPAEYPDGSPANTEDLTPIQRVVLTASKSLASGTDAVVFYPDPEEQVGESAFTCAVCGEPVGVPKRPAVELWEDNAGGLHLVGGSDGRVWSFLSTIFAGATFGADSLAMQLGDDTLWLDDYGDVNAEDRPSAHDFHEERRIEKGNPNGMKLVAVRTEGGRIELTDAYRGHNARAYLAGKVEA